MSPGPALVPRLPRPFAIVVVAVALLALAVAAPAPAPASGGISTTANTGPADSKSGGGRTAAKYVRLWDRTSKRNKRWAHRTAQCESGRDPKAIGGGGRYRGAFQF